MSKGEELSLEEKRRRILELFFAKRNFFLLKELEKIAPTGIISQSDKDMIQSLVDECLIHTDKIGTSAYFWSFPRNEIINRKRKFDEESEEYDEVQKKKKCVEAVFSKARIGREDTSDRDALLLNLETMKRKNNELDTELKKFRNCDPEVLEDMNKKNEIAKEAVNRWTDNIISIKTWVQSQQP